MESIKVIGMPMASVKFKFALFVVGFNNMKGF